MYSVVLAIHLTICLVLCVVVLLQQGKGADIGAVFGGSSQTVFGSSGAGNFLTKLTGGLAAAFFCTSLYLAYSSTHRMTSSIFTGAPAPITAPAKPLTAPVKPLSGPAKPAGTHQ
jgi:preprotein translocase subunit SecG